MGHPADRRGGTRGRPADPPFEGMWWLYVPMAFDDFSIVIIIQEDPSGFRSLNDAPGSGRTARRTTGWPRVKIHYSSGTRIPTGATIDATAHDGTPVHFDVESKLPVPIHVGGGYGGDRTGSTACGRATSSPNDSPTT